MDTRRIAEEKRMLEIKLCDYLKDELIVFENKTGIRIRDLDLEKTYFTNTDINFQAVSIVEVKIKV
jgi:hypothetical protein